MAKISEALALALASHRAGQFEQAAEICRRIVAVEPQQAEAWHLLGVVAFQRGQFVEAETRFRTAIGSDAPPGDFQQAEFHNSLGIVLKRQGKLGAAVAAYDRAVLLRSDYSEAHYNRAIALLAQGRLDEALAGYDRACQLNPHDLQSHSNRLLALQYHPASTPATLAAAHAEFERRHAAPLRAGWRPHANRRDPDRPLRLGFVSPDLCRSPVGSFFVRFLEHLDPRQAEAVCYSQRTVEDELTGRIRGAAGGWREVHALGDEQLAEQIRADGIDILFDLAGHTGGNRLLVFARRPAPIQITWLGYVGTTGLAAMDYLLADPREVPPALDAHYAEQVLRMPNSYVCFLPPADAPAVGPLPAAAAGRVTFGSFNNLAKIGPQVAAVWAEVLRRVPGSRLIVQYFGLDDVETAADFRRRLAACGVGDEQLELSGGALHEEFIVGYNRVDLALDTFPYSGGLTTCEALWMGVPVVTLPGQTFAGRHGLSHLTSVGLTETIAGDPQQYVDLAVALAGDRPRLAALRAGLRHRVARSPLCDGPRFARDLLEQLRAAWRRWVAGACC